MSSPLFLSSRWLIVKTPAWKLYSLFPEEKALVAGGCCVLRASEWRALKLREEAEGWVGKEKALGMEPPFSELRELAMGDAHKTHETCVPGSRCWKQVLQCSQTAALCSVVSFGRAKSLGTLSPGGCCPSFVRGSVVFFGLVTPSRIIS